MKLRRILPVRLIGLLLPALAALVVQTVMLVSMAQAGKGLDIANHQAHVMSAPAEADRHHPVEMPCHDSSEQDHAAKGSCVTLCCLALPAQAVLMVLSDDAEPHGAFFLPVLRGVLTIPPSPPPRG